MVHSLLLARCDRATPLHDDAWTGHLTLSIRICDFARRVYGCSCLRDDGFHPASLLSSFGHDLGALLLELQSLDVNHVQLWWL